MVTTESIVTRTDDLVVETLPNGQVAFLRPDVRHICGALGTRDRVCGAWEGHSGLHNFVMRTEREDESCDAEEDEALFSITYEGRRALRMAELFGTKS